MNAEVQKYVEIVNNKVKEIEHKIEDVTSDWQLHELFKNELSKLISGFPSNVRESQEFRLEIMSNLMNKQYAKYLLGRALGKAVEYCPAVLGDEAVTTKLEKRGTHVLNLLSGEIEINERNIGYILPLLQESEKKTLHMLLFKNRNLLEVQSVKDYMEGNPDFKDDLYKAIEHERKVKEGSLETLLARRAELENELKWYDEQIAELKSKEKDD